MLNQSGPENLIQLARSYQTVAVQGVQWWDEWKGKWVSTFYGDPTIEWICGALGGWNAGHNIVINGKKIATHELPGGAGHPTARVYLGTGRVINISDVASEIQQIHDAWVNVKNKFVFSGWAMVNLRSVDRLIDAAIEKSKWKNATGTTMKGIWPSIANNDFRIGFTMNELIEVDEDNIRQKVRVLKKFYGSNIWTEKDIIDEIRKECDTLKKLIDESVLSIDTYGHMMSQEARGGKRMLIEWNQAVLLGKYAGAYPKNTTSNPSIAWMMDSLGLWNYIWTHLGIGVAKAIPTKVWGGTEFFPTRWSNMDPTMGEEASWWDYFEGNFARSTGEMWATTWRVREVSHWDQVQVNHSLDIGGKFHVMIITKSDVIEILGKMLRENWRIPEYRMITSYQQWEKDITSGLYPAWKIDGYNTQTFTIQDGNNQRILQALANQFPSMPVFFGNGEKESDLIQFQ